MPSEVREVQQAGADATWFSTGVGKARQWIIDIATFRPHIMDGTTAGGKTLAFESELLTKVSTLTQTAIDNVLTVLGIYEALEELIVEYGGTVPTDSNTQSVQTLSANDDPWSEFN